MAGETTGTMKRPDWLVPGTEVAELQRGANTTRSSRVLLTTIDRVLKRDVVLTNGNRYNADRLQRSIGTWSPTYYLLPADDPDVTKALAEQARSSTVSKVEGLLTEWRRTPFHERSDDHLLQARDLLTDLLDGR